jgi:hypothetical protein
MDKDINVSVLAGRVRSMSWSSPLPAHVVGEPLSSMGHKTEFLPYGHRTPGINPVVSSGNR